MNDPVKQLDDAITSLNKLRHQILHQSHNGINLPVNQALQDYASPASSNGWKDITQEYWRLTITYIPNDEGNTTNMPLTAVSESEKLDELITTLDDKVSNVEEECGEVVAVSINPHVRFTDKVTVHE